MTSSSTEPLDAWSLSRKAYACPGGRLRLMTKLSPRPATAGWSHSTHPLGVQWEGEWEFPPCLSSMTPALLFLCLPLRLSHLSLFLWLFSSSFSQLLHPRAMLFALFFLSPYGLPTLSTGSCLGVFSGGPRSHNYSGFQI